MWFWCARVFLFTIKKYLIKKTHSSGKRIPTHRSANAVIFYLFFAPLWIEMWLSGRGGRETARPHNNKWWENFFFTSSSDTAESFNQDWCLETSAYGGIKFTSGSDVQRGASPLQPSSSDVSRICFFSSIIWATNQQNGSAEELKTRLETSAHNESRSATSGGMNRCETVAHLNPKPLLCIWCFSHKDFDQTTCFLRLDWAAQHTVRQQLKVWVPLTEEGPLNRFIV